MPVYEYIALDGSGKRRRGIVDADSPVAARRKLRNKGAFPVEVIEATPRSKTRPGADLTGFLSRPKAAELALMTRQLATLLAAGLPLVSALEVLVAQASRPALKRVLTQVKDTVNEGRSLSEALARHPRLFSEVYVNMVRAGENSGALDLVLERLASLAERGRALRARAQAALAYPVLMGVVGSVVLVFLVSFVVPGIVEIFEEMRQALPWPTVILIQCSRFLSRTWWVILLALAGLAAAIRRLRRTRSGRRVEDWLKLRLPLSGPIHSRLAMGRFARTLGGLLQSGVPLLPALRIVRNVVHNVWLAEIIDRAAAAVEAGSGLAGPLSHAHRFPPMVVQMVAVGEQSGQMEQMLQRIAEMNEQEAEARLTTVTSLLEPLMILLMGCAVGFIVVSILFPLFEMNQLVR